MLVLPFFGMSLIVRSFDNHNILIVKTLHL
jgi:hypothetical protein